MTKSIIQHHKTIDFGVYFENIRAGYIGIDYMDFEIFMQNEGEKHSFVTMSDGSDRIRDSLTDAILSAGDLVDKVTSMMIIIVRSTESNRPITMAELQFLNDFLSQLPDNIDATWGMADDGSLGNGVRIILIINTKD